MIVFDFETGPQDNETLAGLWTPPDCSDLVPSEFDPALVKCGNLKDVNKINEKIAKAKSEHEARQERLEEEREARTTKAWAEFVAAAPLSPIYGRVVALGLFAPESRRFVFVDGNERIIIETFWGKVDECIETGRMMAGHNIREFDLPFVVQRSWILGVSVPARVISGVDSQWPKFNSIFIDTRKLWLCGTNHKGSSFSDLAKAFKTGGKHDGLDGSKFSELLANDRERAIEYLREDCMQPAAWLERMGIQ